MKTEKDFAEMSVYEFSQWKLEYNKPQTFQVRTFTQMNDLVQSGRAKSGDIVNVRGERFTVK